MVGTLLVIGKNGADVVDQDPLPHGTDGKPLGDDGNGTPGKAKWGKCKTAAQPGDPGNHGDTAPVTKNGGNADSAYGLTFTCSEYVGGTILLLNHGGDGGKGGNAGRGGNGSDGGDAGHQPKDCTEVIYGGTGGNSGQGGSAGCGGDAGSAGDVNVIYGPGISGTPVSVHSTAGKAGMQGLHGNGGNPGAGGKNSDGTSASGGGNGGSGSVGHGGKSGYDGSVNYQPDPKAAPKSLSITILPRIHDSSSTT
ncbi:MAG: hypothetical protein U9P00_13865 [Pseudomonadota bacterium]|nr:hypothetical protein [Pseudomonadota bacterium]